MRIDAMSCLEGGEDDGGGLDLNVLLGCNLGRIPRCCDIGTGNLTTNPAAEKQADDGCGDAKGIHCQGW